MRMMVITGSSSSSQMNMMKMSHDMQRLQPKVQALKEKYKGNKEAQNRAMMELYKEEGINPAGQVLGCLPMLLQLPFLYGFYRVLDLSIELRHAPWILWLKDLSAPDHLYILLVLMIVTMFILQKMTPIPTADPAQQRMMTIMPIFFGFMFYRVASGLVLYWLTSNVVGIAQQAFINRIMPSPQKGPVPRKPTPAAKD